MLKIQKIKNELERNGFSVMYEKFNSPIIEVGVPLPRNKISVETGMFFYGNITINTDTLNIIKSDIYLVTLGDTPALAKVQKYWLKMCKAHNKIENLILNAKVTKEDVIKELRYKNIDEELINFIKENW